MKAFVETYPNNFLSKGLLQDQPPFIGGGNGFGHKGCGSCSTQLQGPGSKQ